MIKAILEIIGALILIVFGLLFLAFLPITFSEIATDSIFIGAGVLFLRRAILDRRKEKIQNQVNQRRQKSSKTNSAKKKIR
jgi:hypothetical protein